MVFLTSTMLLRGMPHAECGAYAHVSSVPNKVSISSPRAVSSRNEPEGSTLGGSDL